MVVHSQTIGIACMSFQVGAGNISLWHIIIAVVQFENVHTLI